MKRYIGAALLLAFAVYWLLPDRENSQEQLPLAESPVASPEVQSPIIESAREVRAVPRVDQRAADCDIRRHYLPEADGTTSEAITCEPVQDAANPYDIYTDHDLLVLAYADAEAAEELGKRLLFQNQLAGANAYLMRAVALRPDDVSPLIYAQSQIGSLRGNAPGARKAVAHAYILSKTASHFDASMSTDWVEPDLEAYEFTDQDIADLDRIVENNLDQMRQIQVEVFGTSDIGEDF